MATNEKFGYSARGEREEHVALLPRRVEGEHVVGLLNEMFAEVMQSTEGWAFYLRWQVRLIIKVISWKVGEACNMNAECGATDLIVISCLCISNDCRKWRGEILKVYEVLCHFIATSCRQGWAKFTGFVGRGNRLYWESLQKHWPQQPSQTSAGRLVLGWKVLVSVAPPQNHPGLVDLVDLVDGRNNRRSFNCVCACAFLQKL